MPLHKTIESRKDSSIITQILRSIIAFPDTWNYYLRLAYVKDLYASRYGDLKYHLRMHVK